MKIKNYIAYSWYPKFEHNFDLLLKSENIYTLFVIV